MYCKQCGKIIPDDSVFCPSCGTQQETMGDDNLKTSPSTNDTEFARNLSSNTDNIHNTVYQPNNKKSSSFRSYILLCVFAVVVAGILTLILSYGNTDFSQSKLEKTSITTANTTLSILTPFKLKDGKFEMPSECKKVVYKTGTSSNYSIEVVGFQFKDISTSVDYTAFLDNFVQEMKNSKEFLFTKPPTPAEAASINGRKGATKRFFIKDSSAKKNIEGNIYALSKSNELWLIMFLYKENDNDAKKITNTIVNKIELN